jgi:hypothetical protein
MGRSKRCGELHRPMRGRRWTICEHCRRTLPLDAFHGTGGGPDGRDLVCRDCVAAERVDHRALNGERISERRREIRAADPERFAEQRRRDRETHREKRIQGNREWYAENREAVLERRRARETGDE